jgi:hypothetical protein
MTGCDIAACGEPILVEGVCYDHAKSCSRCDGPSRVGKCEDADLCSKELAERRQRDAWACGEEN